MLSVPFKVTRDVDFSRPLGRYISEKYSPEEAARHQPAITAFQHLRSQATAIQIASPSAFETLARYACQVDAAAAKFPNSDTEIRVQLAWNDTLRPAKLTSQCSWNYERACILFNMAALESSAGCMTSRDSEEGIKKAAQHFQKAAGVFTYIRDHVCNTLGGVLPCDLSGGGLSMLILLMQAQAQACFYEKASRAAMKPNILARVAWQAHEFYKAAGEALAGPQMAEINKVYPWGAHMAFQANSFEAVAYFKQSDVSHAKGEATTEGFGEAITYLTLAEHSVGKALDSARAGRLPPAAAEGLGASIAQRKRQAVDDNNSVYMNPVPDVSKVPKPTGAVLAKIGAMPDLAPYAGDEIFGSLLPMEITMAAVEFASETTEMVRVFKERGKAASEAGKQELAALGLPGAVDGAESSAGLPEATWDKVYAVQIRGGFPALQAAVTDSMDKASAVETKLAKVGSDLDQEEKDDSSQRGKYGDAWQCVPSADVNASMRADVARYMEVMRVARDSDASVQAKLFSNQESLALLSKTRDELNSLIPSGSADTTSATAERERLKASLLELGTLIANRESLAADLATAAQAPTLPATLHREGLDRKDAVFAAARAAIKPAQDAIDLSIAHQGALLERIKLENRAFNDARAHDAASVARQEALQRIELGLNKFDEIMSNLKEGQVFYDDLLSHVSKLENNVAGMIAARAIQKKELMLDLDHRTEHQSQVDADAAFARSLAEAGAPGGPPPPGAPPPGAYGAGAGMAPPMAMAVPPPIGVPYNGPPAAAAGGYPMNGPGGVPGPGGFVPGYAPPGSPRGAFAPGYAPGPGFFPAPPNNDSGGPPPAR